MKQILLFLAIFYGVMANATAQTFEVGSIKYNVVSAVSPFTVEVVAKTPIYSGAVTIPAQVTNGATTYSVIRIGQQAFQNCVGLTSVSMPNSVTDINLSAFAGCTALTNVVVSTNLKNIKAYAFTGCSSLVQITLPNSLLTIGNYAFRGCSLLTTVAIPASVTSIGVATFANCAMLTSLSVHANNTVYKTINGAILTKDGITLIQAPTGVSTFEIPTSVTTLANFAFSDCINLQTVLIPNSVTSIGESVFSNNTALKNIYCNAVTPPTVANANAFLNVPATANICVPSASVNNYKTATYWKDFTNISASLTPTQFMYNGLKYSVSLTDPTTVEVIADVVQYSGDIVIPEKALFNYQSQSFTVTGIGRSAFSDCDNLTSLTMPNTITEIKDYAFFQATSMTKVQLSSSLQKIGVSAFERCYDLTDITLPTSLKYIGDWAFDNCTRMPSLSVPNSVTTIGAGAFANNSVNTLVLQNGNLNYKQVDGAIYNMNGDTIMYVPAQATSFTIPSTVSYINKAAFAGCSLTSISIPSTVKGIGGAAFSNCKSLLEVTIPSTLTKVPYNILLGCSSLTTVHLPENIDEIEGLAFYYCSSLKTIDIPAGVKTIGYQAFYASGLTSLYVHATTPPIIDNTTFSYVNKTIPVLVPAGSVDAYKAANYWKDFTNIIAIPQKAEFSYNGLKYSISIGTPTWVEVIADAVEYTGDIVIPEQVIFYDKKYTVNGIGRGAFRDCDNLTSLIMPNTITEIKDYAFFQALSMTKVQLSSSLQKIGISAFERCYYLTDITLPTSLKYIGDWAFDSCTRMPSLSVPNSVTTIGAGAFAKNSANTLVLQNGNLNYKQVDGAIYNMNGDTIMYVPAQATSFTIPSTVSYINKAAFAGCSLTSISIPSTVKGIGGAAFSDCEDLLEVTIPTTITKIPYNMFLGCTSLTTVHLPQNIDEIQGLAFYYCSSLKTIDIPAGVKAIGYQAFYNCGLTSLYVRATTPPTIDNTTFYNVNKTIPLHVPAGSVLAYKTANYWKEFTNFNPIAISLETSDYKDITVQNPIYSVLKIDNLATASVIELFNTTGALLIKEEVNNSFAEINVATLPKGIYIVRVTQTGRTKSFKVTKN